MEPSERRKIALETLGVVKGRKFHKKNKKRHPRKVCTRLMDNDMPQKRKRTYFSCSRKVQYSSESDAHKMAKHSEKVRGVPLRVYYCSICNGWHITKKVFRNLGKRKWVTMSIDSYRRGGQFARYLDAFCLNAAMQSPDFGEDSDPDPTDYEELPDPEESVRDCDKPDAKNCKTNVTQYQLTSQDVEEIKAYAEKYYHGDTTLAEYWWRHWNGKK